MGKIYTQVGEVVPGCQFKVGDKVQHLGEDPVGEVLEIDVRFAGDPDYRCRFKYPDGSTEEGYYEENFLSNFEE